MRSTEAADRSLQASRLARELCELSLRNTQQHRDYLEEELLRTRRKLASIDPDAPRDAYDGPGWVRYLA